MHAAPPPSPQKTRFSARTLRAVCVLALFVATFSGPSAHATSGTWTGTTNFLWSDPANWTPNGVPGSGDTATFNNAGFLTTSISLLGVDPVTVASIVFDTASVASYNIGDDMETLTLNAAGTITMNSTVAVDQNIGANLILGTAGGNDAFTFNNNSVVPDAVLFFSGNISSGANSGVKTVTVTGAGITEVAIGSITNGTGSVVLAKTGTGTLNLGPSSTLGFNTLNASGGTTNIDAALGSGPGTASVSATTTANVRFGTVSQRLSSLTIGAGSTVTFTSGPAAPFADPAGGGKGGGLSAAIVPEPGTCGLLITALLGPLLRRRRD